MKQKLKQSKGITLISLVVTIIVLIILAGISLYLVLGENGLIEKAKETKPIVDITSAQEKLELVKGPVQLEKYGVNLDDYLEELEKVKEKYEVDDVERIDNDNAEIIIGGKYKFIATDEKNGNVKITYQGEVGGLEISPISGTYKYPTTGTFEVIKNISGGELSVKSENENIAKASISGTIVTVVPQDMAGTTKIVVTSAAKGEYAQGKAIYTAIVENGTISLDADAYTGNYDGKDHDAVSNVKVTPADATLTYSLNGGTFSSTIPKVNGATTYTIVVKATKAGYATKTLTKTITIGKNTETGNLVLSANSGTITYPTAGTFTVTKNTSGGALSVTSSDTNVATASISGTTVTITPKAISADGKKTTITVTSAATSNYEAQTKEYTATVNMGTITLSADAYTGNYDGKDHDAVSNVKVTPADATLTYSLNGGTFSSTIPKVNGATTYTIVVKATKAGYATKTLTKTITIGKNTETGNLVLSANSGTITYPTAGTFTVTKNTSGGALSVTSSDTNVATASISGTTVTITPKAISADGKKTTITVTSAATSNYEAQTKTYATTVNMGAITLSADAYTGKYDGKDHNAVSNVKVTPADATLTYSLNGGTFSSTIPKVNGATTYTIVVKATKAGYATKTLTKTITIGKNTETGNLVLSANSGTITYPTAGTFTVTKNTSGGALSVTSSDTNVATASISGTTVTITPKAISADGKKTTITVTSAATSNYEAQTKTYTATVNMGTISLETTIYTGINNGREHEIVTGIKVTPSDAKIEYSLDGGKFSTNIPKVSDAKIHSVSIKASKTGYATKSITKTIELDKSEVERYRDSGTYVTTKTTLKDSEENEIKLPAGFKIAPDSGINVTEGIVIEDKDIISGIGNNRGNQYVWIPVNTKIKKNDGTLVDITLGRYTFASNGTPIIQQNATNYTAQTVINTYYKELTISRVGTLNNNRTQDKNATALNLKGFIDSVKENEGYYIARYEASYGKDGKANSKVSNSYSESATPTTEGTLWSQIYQKDATIASRNLYETATTDLINSYAWDTALVYIQNFSGDTAYSIKDGKSINASLTNTGVNGDEKCKINDMASNLFEWTTEYGTYVNSYYAAPCVYRGGRYDQDAGCGNRNYNTMAYGQLTFRNILYM